MRMGERFAGETFYDALGNCQEPVTIDEDGWGAFRTEGGSVSIWVRASAFEDLIVNE
jgi:alpha-amylase